MAERFTNKEREMQGRIDNLLAFLLKACGLGTFHGLATVYYALIGAWRKDWRKLSDHGQWWPLVSSNALCANSSIDDTRGHRTRSLVYSNGPKRRRPSCGACGPDKPWPLLTKGMRELYYHYEEACERSVCSILVSYCCVPMSCAKARRRYFVNYQDRFRHVAGGRVFKKHHTIPVCLATH